MLAMVDNDNAGFLNERGAFKSIASVLAPTEGDLHPTGSMVSRGRTA
jgi:hypothetical protein